MKRKLAILGAGESGTGSAVLAAVKGFDVFVSDHGEISNKYRDMLDSHGIRWEQGRHTEEEILNAAEVIKSPGIREDSSLVVKIRSAGIPVISEIEFAARYSEGIKICVTGSNGKTTVTNLICHMLEKAGKRVEMAGKVGRSFAM